MKRSHLTILHKLYKIVLMEIQRSLYKALIDEISRPEITILLGSRQVGKTFLLKKIEKECIKKGLKTSYFNLEVPADSIFFNDTESNIFEKLTKNTEVLFIDEFHYLKNASKLFKAIYDDKKNIKIFATGSSSIEIHKHLKESLAGRRTIYKISPVVYQELITTFNINMFKEYCTFGGLPELYHYKDPDRKINKLKDILETYILKDVKSLVREENINAFNNLIYLLAENQGSTISSSNLAKNTHLTPRTIEHYLSILEHTYTGISLHSYSNNLGNELKKTRKFYLYDLGIRNAILKDFRETNNRQDKGAIYETFVLLQLINHLKPNMELKFWRTKSQMEIDFVLLTNRQPLPIEVKSHLNYPEIHSGMKAFFNRYPSTPKGIIFNENLNTKITYQDKEIIFTSFDKITSENNQFHLK